MMRKLFACVICLPLLLFVSGCWDLNIIEELSLVFAIGFDLDEENKELLVMTTTNPAFSEEAEVSTTKTTVQGYNFSQAFVNAQLQRQNRLVLGQVDALVFSEEMALTGRMHQVMLEVDQQRDMTPNARLVIVRGASAQDVMQLEPPEETRLAIYLSKLLERNFNNGTVPLITASRYWFKQTNPCISSVVPIIEITGHEDEKTGLVIAGLAAIDADGLMAGSISDREIVHFLMLSGQLRRSRFYTQVNWPEVGEARLTALIKHARRQVQSEIVGDKVRIHIDLEVELDVLDVNANLDAIDDERFGQLEKLLARDIQGNALAMLRKTQAWRADIVGLGRYVRVKHPQWFRTVDWVDEYEKADISMEVRVDIRRIGTLTNPEY